MQAPPTVFSGLAVGLLRSQGLGFVLLLGALHGPQSCFGSSVLGLLGSTQLGLGGSRGLSYFLPPPQTVLLVSCLLGSQKPGLGGSWNHFCFRGPLQGPPNCLWVCFWVSWGPSNLALGVLVPFSLLGALHGPQPVFVALVLGLFGSQELGFNVFLRFCLQGRQNCFLGLGFGSCGVPGTGF